MVVDEFNLRESGGFELLPGLGVGAEDVPFGIQNAREEELLQAEHLGVEQGHLPGGFRGEQRGRGHEAGDQRAAGFECLEEMLVELNDFGIIRFVDVQAVAGEQVDFVVQIQCPGIGVQQLQGIDAMLGGQLLGALECFGIQINPQKLGVGAVCVVQHQEIAHQAAGNGGEFLPGFQACLQLAVENAEAFPRGEYGGQGFVDGAVQRVAEAGRLRVMGVGDQMMRPVRVQPPMLEQEASQIKLGEFFEECQLLGKGRLGQIPQRLEALAVLRQQRFKILVGRRAMRNEPVGMVCTLLGGANILIHM